MMPYRITTQRDLRAAFWAQTQHKRRFVCSNMGKRQFRAKTQNEYPAEVRTAWVDFVDHMEKSGQISEALAQRATL